MNDLISREGLIKEVCGKCDGACDCCCEENCIQCKRPNMRCDFRKDLDEAPTVDAVTVVRCKDCKQWRRNIGFTDNPNGHCFYHDIDTNGFDFCSYGERRKDNA